MKSRFILALLALGFCTTSPLSSRLLPSASAQPLPDRLPLVGTIVDDAGQPVAGIIVSVRRQDYNGAFAFWGAEVMTDDQGRFVVPRAEEGNYYINIDTEMPKPFNLVPLVSAPIVWRVGAQQPRLVLVRRAKLTLQIQKPDGSPLADTPFFIRLRTEGVPSPGVTRLTTDASGKVAFPNGLAPSTYSLFLASTEGYVIKTDFDVRYQNTPINLDLKLSAGATVRVSAQTNLATPSGHVDTPLGGASLSLLAASPDDSLQLAGAVADPGEDYALLAAANDRAALVTRDGSGKVELLHVPAGRFIARVALPGYGISPVQQITLTNGQTFDLPVTFPARKAASVQMTVLKRDGTPVIDTEVGFRMLPLAADNTVGEDASDGAPIPGEPIPGTEGVGDAPDLPFFPGGAGGRVGQTDEKGTLTLYPLKPGRYRIFVSRRLSRLQNPFGLMESEPLDIEVSAQKTNSFTVRVP